MQLRNLFLIGCTLLFTNSLIAQESCENSIDTLVVSTGYDDSTNSVYPDFSLDPLWRLTQVPPDPSGWTSNIGGPAIVIPTSNSWSFAGPTSKYLNAFPTNQALTDNWSLSTNEYIYQRTFCICDLPETVDSAEVTIELAVHADNWAEVLLEDNAFNLNTLLSQPYVYSTSNFSGGPTTTTVTVMLTEGSHRLFLLHRNRLVDMGVSLDGSISSPYLLPNELCESGGSAGGVLYEDENNNQSHELGEEGISNTEVLLLNEDKVKIATSVSDDAGYYFFMDIPAGSYYIKAGYNKDWSLQDASDSLVPITINTARTVRVDLGMSNTPTGIAESNSNSTLFKVYPNPVGQEVSLYTNGDATLLSLRLYNLNGQIVQSSSEDLGERIVVDVGGLPEGTYLLEAITTNGEIHRKRLVKLRQ